MELNLEPKLYDYEETMKIVDVVVSTMTKTEMSCNRLTQTLRRINESMLPDFSLSLLPLLFFCPFLFGVNEPRNERDSRAAHGGRRLARANGGPRRRRPVGLRLRGGRWEHVWCPAQRCRCSRQLPTSIATTLQYFPPTHIHAS